MKLYITICAILINSAWAQKKNFITEGVIEYEKSVNMYAIIKSSINKTNQSTMSETLAQYRNSKPQFEKLKSNLVFNGTRSLFTPIPLEQNISFDIPMIYQHNIIYSDLRTKMSVTQKKVYDETFLITDSIRAIRWKITGEMREIAGYTCRRANAVIMDSIYVVAFYSIEIPVSAGPESFTGLPGMILGLAIPHENVTWFASKVNSRHVLPNEINVPSKGQLISNKGLAEKLGQVLKYWGEYAVQALKAFQL